MSDLGDGRRATLYDGQWMWAATRIDATNVITVRLDASSLHEQDAVRIRTLAVALGLALVASAGLGWGVGSTLSGRVRRAVRTVHAVERGEQGVRVHSGGNDEVAVLTASVDAMADALAGRLALEQAFTADVAHELRTPLTALVTASELLPDDPASDLTRSQVARMRRLVEDLLTLSRLDAAVEESARETIDLADAAREALSLAAPRGAGRPRHPARGVERAGRTRPPPPGARRAQPARQPGPARRRHGRAGGVRDAAVAAR